MLPHAHATPDRALKCVRFDASCISAQEASGRTPSISLVQLPCCSYIWHDSALGTQPDDEYLDSRIAASARSVRVWADVSSRFDFLASSRTHGVPRTAMDLGLSKARKRERICGDECQEKVTRQGNDSIDFAARFQLNDYKE